MIYYAPFDLRINRSNIIVKTSVDKVNKDIQVKYITNDHKFNIHSQLLSSPQISKRR